VTPPAGDTSVGRRSEPGRRREFAAGAHGQRYGALPTEEFRQALDNGEVVLHYQPQIDLRDGGTRGAEALLRWQHPVGGLLPPDNFLPALANTKLMPTITDWVIRRACVTAATWCDLAVAVNITAGDAGRGSLVDVVRTALADSGLASTRLILEVTEHALLQDMARATKNLGRLAKDGVRVSLDDFGTGYSSMLYLRELPIREIKIDGTFTAGLGKNADDDGIVAGLIKLAHAVGVQVVAEGVETVTQAGVLASFGCDAAQGYLYGQAEETLTLPSVPTNSYRRPRTARRRKSPTGQHVSADTQEIIRGLVGNGASLHTIAAALNRQGINTPQGTRWTGSTVGRALAEW
jgi:EAL domain-containing protein (putative c-di-GMP-specific phosphodiesterase class I)